MRMASGAANQKVMTFDEAWPILQEEAINKIIDHLEGIQNHQFTSGEYMRFYTIVYNVCFPDKIGPENNKMYEQYKKTFQDYISSKVLPSLRGKKNEDLLQELLKRWNNHKILTRWLSRFFHYLDRYFAVLKNLPGVGTCSHLIFYNLVYGELNDQIRDAIISLIDKEREGEQIDEETLKKALDIYVEIEEGSKKYYEKDFEEAMMNATTTFYSKKALEWISNESYEDYMIKVEECINLEKNRVSNYLKFRSKNKIIEIVQHELLNVHASKLEEKKHYHEAVNKTEN
ncbi:hypothetical protein ACJIZ3_017415 [Penstemon smallii]|uniref:Cullin N-terminal domain-containing protein n=1 Tax=Penstemon smallii TaxID=265156 RepID=A0ABD3SWL8_9LAMI